MAVKNTAASEAARLLGSIKTKAKAAAARENGKLGGRPKGSGKKKRVNQSSTGSDKVRT